MSSVFSSPQAGKDVGQLHDELIRAGLTPQVVQSDGTTIFLTYPDGQAQGPINAIVSAHVPQTRYDPSVRLAEVATLRRESGRLALLARVRGATTVADLKAVVLAHLQEEPTG